MDFQNKKNYYKQIKKILVFKKLIYPLKIYF